MKIYAMFGTKTQIKTSFPIVFPLPCACPFLVEIIEIIEIAESV